MTKTFYAGHTDETGVFRPMLPFSAHEEHTWSDDGELLVNPHYVPDQSLNLSNANADYVASVLGFDPDEKIPIAEAIAATSAWLAGNPTPSRAVPARDMNTGPMGPRIIDCGLPEGYLNEKAVALLRICVAGQVRGATHLVLV